MNVVQVNVIFLKNGIEAKDGLHYVGVCDDEHLEEELNKLQKELGYSDEKMENFVYVAREELNTVGYYL